MPGPEKPETSNRVVLLRAPGVYRPQEDSALLAEALLAAPPPEGGRVLDVGTGTGMLALLAARAGAGEVVALDVSRRALLTAWLNARLRLLPVRTRRGDAKGAQTLGRFDLVVANPPYVPWPGEGRRRRGWDAGPDGRAVLDPLCAAAPELLSPRGFVLLVQSALAGADRTEDRLRRFGLKTSVVARRRLPFGTVLRGRTGYLERSGLIEPGEREEELVVIRADRTEPSA